MAGRRTRAPWLPVTDTAPTSTTDDPPPAIRVLVLERAGGQCESCGDELIISRRSLHHRRPKGMGGSREVTRHSPVNLLVLCGRDNTDGCHGDVHGYPTAARDAGLLVRRAADPARVPVLIHGKRLVLLTAEGTYAEEAR
ncbi:HNH endonuclease [Frankia sp. Mgl5]|uniref:HNH endonuclease n=1 Tax=Frankia sp. Mgl5 TaxID=2933793 RepID=UPI00200EDB76|nr:HNH endonuclease signature motif containing protein [Frankia sp. Mgl5]MCK9928781.1 HNH endonuclease [Frankia sp. Mgl5]